MSDTMQIFDRNLVRLRRDKAASTLHTADFLLAETAERLADRLLDVTRTFPRALDLGCHTGQLAPHIKSTNKVDLLLQAEYSENMAATGHKKNGLLTLCADEEFLPVAAESLDLVLSNLSLHWINDLPGALTQIRRSIKPDGLFLATTFGGETLKELREVLMEAESQTTGGVTPRISPFVDVREAGNLLSRAGFALPVVDAENIEVTYENIFKLMADLRAMGETNAVVERRKSPSNRATFMRAAQLYEEKFTNERNRIVATFQIVTLTAWSPHASQQKALRPGSAKAKLADALETNEISLDEKTPFSK